MSHKPGAHSDQPHVIRLRGPWQVACGSSAAGEPPAASREVRLPATYRGLVADHFDGRLELARGFNWPETLGYRESLWLVVTGADWPQLSAELNGQHLAPIEEADRLPAAWEITQGVAAHNTLKLVWVIPVGASFAGKSWVDVQLEVRLDVGPGD